jgi:hypothetical protein
MNFDLGKFIASLKRTDPMIAKDITSWRPDKRTKLPSVLFGQYKILKRNDKYFPKSLD